MKDVRTLLHERPYLKRMIPAAAALVMLLALAVWIFWWPHSFSDPSERVVTVSRGMSFGTIVDSLEARGIIGSRTSIKIAGRLLGLTREVKVGRYYFSSGISNLSILYDLRDGVSRRLISVAIPEGARMKMIARRFEHELGVDSAKIMALCTDSTFADELGIPAKDLEGFLLPDTYFFQWQTDEREIVERLVTSFKEFYVDSLKERQRKLGMTIGEVVTLASIVEGEARLDSERTLISGVYHNRLKKRMRLEADPTIQYVLPNGPRRLLYSDLQIESPYNTYRHYGLPPGPINNPGRQAILATLYPAQHRYLYFVADGRGGHRFSTSFSEHQRAIRLYHRVRREMLRQAHQGG